VAAAIASGIALLALEPRLCQENGKKDSEVVPSFCQEEQGETRYSLLLLFRRSVLVQAQYGKDDEGDVEQLYMTISSCFF
jgi:hypothetical protein